MMPHVEQRYNRNCKKTGNSKLIQKSLWASARKYTRTEPHSFIKQQRAPHLVAYHRTTYIGRQENLAVTYRHREMLHAASRPTALSVHDTGFRNAYRFMSAAVAEGRLRCTMRGRCGHACQGLQTVAAARTESVHRRCWLVQRNQRARRRSHRQHRTQQGARFTLRFAAAAAASGSAIVLSTPCIGSVGRAQLERRR